MANTNEADRSVTVEHEIHPLLRNRRSHRAFADRPVGMDAVRSMLEAARWAPSSRNEQPWRFLVAHAADRAEFDRLLACLNPTNQVWAKNAGVLMLGVAATRFARNGSPNPHALHDHGLAVSQLVTQASALGLGVRQMAGFDAARARETYAIPPEFEPVAAIAAGYPADPATLPPDLAERERAPRKRRVQEEFVFRGVWNAPLRDDETR